MKKNTEAAGNAMLITTILLLVMTVLIAACINIAGMQFDLSMLQRNTSNTYYLAKSGAAKEVDLINKALQTEMTNNLEALRSEVLNPATTFSDTSQLINTAGSTSPSEYKAIIYSEADGKLEIAQDTLKEKLGMHCYDFIKENFFPKEFKYTVKSDRQRNNAVTEITVKAQAIYNVKPPGNTPDLSSPQKDIFKIISTASSKDGTEILDTQTVEAVVSINIPSSIENEIKEKYVWIGNPPEILDSAVTCFADLSVTSRATLTVKGDMRVKGNRKTGSGSWPEVDESGGIIVSNGGKLKVTEIGGPGTTPGNIYCMNNVATTNGWESYGDYDAASEITVAGDIIANTVGIFDDFYAEGKNSSPFGDTGTGKKVRNNRITAEKNIFVDNDVKIDRFVEEISSPGASPQIDVKGSIFGISDNNLSGAADFDPNSSSGVFNEGNGTLIKADKMFVNGQPYITLEEGKSPIKLWESIGEPFNGVRDQPGYKDGTSDLAGDASYLVKATSKVFDFIKTNKIVISDISKSYATGYISANNEATPIKGNYFLTQTDAGLLFYVPGTLDFDWKGLAKDNGYASKDYIVTESTRYYNADKSYLSQPGMYKKFYNPPLPAKNGWQKLKAYMTAMRSVFYGAYTSTDAAGIPAELSSNKVISFPSISNTWSYNNPIQVVSGEQTVDISNFYVKDELSTSGTNRPYPTIILNNSSEKLSIKASSMTDNLFRGIIISKGDVEIQGKVNIEGAVIIKGKNEGNLPKDRKYIMLGEDTKDISGENPYSPGLKVGGVNTEVTITQNPNVLLEMNFANRIYLRKVMDALKITQYEGKTNLGEILGPYNYAVGADGKPHINNAMPSYNLGRVVLSKDSILDIKTNKIGVNIKNMKKVNQ